MCSTICVNALQRFPLSQRAGGLVQALPLVDLFVCSNDQYHLAACLLFRAIGHSQAGCVSQVEHRKTRRRRGLALSSWRSGPRGFVPVFSRHRCRRRADRPEREAPAPDASWPFRWRLQRGQVHRRRSAHPPRECRVAQPSLSERSLIHHDYVSPALIDLLHLSPTETSRAEILVELAPQQFVLSRSLSAEPFPHVSRARKTTARSGRAAIHRY